MAKCLKLQERIDLICGTDIGNIVLSSSGRDRGNYFIVIKVEDSYVYLVDGDIRKIENPKKKKIKHIEITTYESKVIAEKILKRNKISNQDIKKALREALS